MKILPGLTAAALFAAGAAQAQGTITLGAGDLRKTMTYQTIDQNNTSVTTGYSGVGSIFTSFASTAQTGIGGVCTASLVGARTAVTAAHCIENFAGGRFDPVTAITFFLPSLGAAIEGDPFTRFRAVDWAYTREYDEFGIASGYDFAMFTLDRDAIGFDTYEFYYGDPLQDFTLVGAGNVGGPTGTDPSLVDYKKRTGANTYEFYGSDIFSNSSEGVVLADFDDGTEVHDVFGRFLGKPGLGITGEANSSQGDSGGPSFIDGKIAAMTSFGITGAIFEGVCGGSPGLVDPYFANGNCTNSSIGEIMGNTTVAFNRDFVTRYLRGGSAAIPEPSTWALLILGFGAVGGAMRRRKAAIAFA